MGDVKKNDMPFFSCHGVGFEQLGEGGALRPRDGGSRRSGRAAGMLTLEAEVLTRQQSHCPAGHSYVAADLETNKDKVGKGVRWVRSHRGDGRSEGRLIVEPRKHARYTTNR